MADGTGLALREGRSGMVASIRVDGFDAVMRLADVLSKAPPGAVPEALSGNPAAIFAVVATGIEMGVGPMEAIRSIHMVEGKPTLGASLMLAQAIRRGVRIQWLRKDADEARARFTRDGYPDHEEVITMAEIRKSGIDQGKSGLKKNWRAFPAAMLTARCVSRALTSWAPDVLGAGTYAEHEIDVAEPEVVDRSRAPDVVEGEVADPIEVDVARVVEALDAAATGDEAKAAWDGPRALIWKRCSADQVTRLLVAKAAAKDRIAAATRVELEPAEPTPEEQRAILEAERAAAEQA